MKNNIALFFILCNFNHQLTLYDASVTCHLDKNETASDFALMPDCKLIIDPLESKLYVFAYL